MSHSPSLRRNGGSSFGAEFHNGLGMSLMSVSSVVLFVDPSYVQRYAHIHVHNTYTYKQVHVTGPARYFGVPVLHNSTADSVERDTGSTYHISVRNSGYRVFESSTLMRSLSRSRRHQNWAYSPVALHSSLNKNALPPPCDHRCVGLRHGFQSAMPAGCRRGSSHH